MEPWKDPGSFRSNPTGVSAYTVSSGVGAAAGAAARAAGGVGGTAGTAVGTGVAVSGGGTIGSGGLEQAAVSRMTTGSAAIKRKLWTMPDILRSFRRAAAQGRYGRGRQQQDGHGQIGIAQAGGKGMAHSGGAAGLHRIQARLVAHRPHCSRNDGRG